MTEKLRIGLLLDDMKNPAWIHRMLETIQDSDFASIELVVLNDREPPPKYSLWERVKRKRGQLGSAIVEKCLHHVHRRYFSRPFHGPDAFREIDLGDLLRNVPVMRVTPTRKKVSDYFSDMDVNRIREMDIDVFIRLGFRILRGRILEAARYGIWSYHHGDNCVNRGGPAGYWEAMESWPETGSVLQILTEDLDNGKILYRSYSCTHGISVEHNRNVYYWKTLSFIPRKLKELHTMGGVRFMEKVEQENAHPTFYCNRLFTQPTNYEHARLLAGKSVEKLKGNILHRAALDQWYLMFDLREGMSTSFWRFKKIVPPKDRFWADPHVLHRNGKYFIFIEEYIYASRKGHIAVIVMDKTGQYEPPLPVLEQPYHLSYPFVFEWDGETFMIPETGDTGRVELYRCKRFPDEWELVTVLMEGVMAYDTTLLHQEGRWWMFTNIIEHEGASSCDELFLFHSKDLVNGEWEPHPLNPIISDVKRARPAGKLFIRNGRLYRPSQDCSSRYGYGFNLSEVTTLTRHEYAEQVVGSVKPNWQPDLLGTHTFNHVNRLTVIDGQMRRRRYL